MPTVIPFANQDFRTRYTKILRGWDWAHFALGDTDRFISDMQDWSLVRNLHLQQFGFAVLNEEAVEALRYHFDYVGDPRSYKWLNTYSITKVWEQMNLSLEYGADRIWVVNVGDLKSLSGMEAFPVTAPSSNDATKSAGMEYKMDLFDTGAMEVTLTLAPTLNFVPGRGLRVAVGMDGAPPQVVDTLGNGAEGDWSKWVSDGVRRVHVPIEVGAPGEHTLHLCRVDAAVAVEWVMVAKGKAASTYLGPPESFRIE